MFIKICAQGNSLYEGGGAMVTYLFLNVEVRISSLHIVI
jgi:hypothetical protein